jgi:hypothetical protein
MVGPNEFQLFQPIGGVGARPAPGAGDFAVAANANSYTYRKDAELTMDQYGRLQPAPNRFPSAAGGTGFKRLADQIH